MTASSEATDQQPDEVVRAPFEPEQVTLPNGSKCVASMARPFIAMLPLDDQTNAEGGHVLMMPVQLSYPTMAALLVRPPITTPYMTSEAAIELLSAMEAVVKSGQLRVKQHPNGPCVGYLPGHVPPKPGEIALPPPSHGNDEMQEFDRSTRDALLKQINDKTIVPKMATVMESLGVNEPVGPPPEPPKAKPVKAKAPCKRKHIVAFGGTVHKPLEDVASQQELAQASAVQAEAAKRVEVIRKEIEEQAAKENAAAAQQRPVVRPLLWQEHLVGWQIQAKQYTTDAIVKGQVRSWDDCQSFMLAFENGSVEPAFLPQPSVQVIDARGTVLDWDSFFSYCRFMGIAVEGDAGYPEAVLD